MKKLKKWVLMCPVDPEEDPGGGDGIGEDKNPDEENG